MIDKTIPIWYWKRKSGFNLGDYLGEFIPAILAESKPIYTELIAKSRAYVTVGSVLNEDIHDKVEIWGAGYIAYGARLTCKPKIYAVRGYSTKDRLEKQGFEICSNIGIGDPALLLPLIINNLDPINSNIIDVGIIPHYSDKISLKKRLQKSQSLTSKIVDIDTHNVTRFIDEIRTCKIIVSSSLHGLIIAHAFKIPAIWVKFSNSVAGNGFKFFDYFSSVGIERYEPSLMTQENIYIENFLEQYISFYNHANINRFDPIQLINSCPFITDRMFRKICNQHRYYIK